VRQGYLSYCAFHTILPVLREVIDEDPQSKAGRILEEMLTPQLDAYEALKKQFGLSQEDLNGQLK
jgi:hypothetical protein